MRGQTAYPLDRRELRKIVGMFDPVARVGEVSAAGVVEVTFADRADARRFVGIAVCGARGARPFAESAVPVVCKRFGPTTLRVVLAPEWRPGGPSAIACPYCGKGSGHESWCRLAAAGVPW